MSEKRRDHRGRILHNGEIQLSDGRYRFKYVDEMGKERCIYSWRLDQNDATPKGKRRTLLLREIEKKIQEDHFEQIATNGGNMTVLELVEKYISTKTGVRPTTVAGYGTVINLLKYGKIRNESKSIAIFNGHSEISVTLNTYTHVNLEDAREDVARIQVV